MCWSMEATLGMVALGSTATVVTIRRRETPAIPATIAWFTLMEALQIGGIATADRCSLPANQVATLLGYLHIAFQPFFVNAFAMALLRGTVRPAARVAVWIACGASATAMLLTLYPMDWAGRCPPGSGLCGAPLCTVSASWHIGWQLPLNDLFDAAGATRWAFGGHPTYLAAAFLLPLAYGAWRFVLWHWLAGPMLAWSITPDMREMPAIWCFFAIGIAVIPLIPWIRRRIQGPGWRPLVRACHGGVALEQRLPASDGDPGTKNDTRQGLPV